MHEQDPKHTEIATTDKTINHVSAMPIAVNCDFTIDKIYSSLPCTTTEDKLSIYDTVISGGEDPKAHVNTVLEMTDLIVFPIQFTDEETGELIRIPSAVVVCADGRRIQFKSMGIWRCLSLLMSLGLTPPWKPPLRFYLKDVQFRNGHSGYRLVRVETKKAKGRSE